MNQVRKSAIQKIPKDSLEYSVAMGLCRMGRATLQNETTSSTNEWELYQKMLLTVRAFIYSCIIIRADIGTK